MMLLLALPALAADFYADPVHGDMSGDGSLAHPWGALEDVIAAGMFEANDWDALPYVEGTSVLVPRTAGPVGPGDTLWLLDGDHGVALFDSLYVDGTITVAAAPGAHPTLGRVRFRASSGWVLRGVTISVELAPEPSILPLVELDSHAWRGPVHDVTVEACDIYTAMDTTTWSAADWDSRSVDGIRAEGDDVTLRGNHLWNVDFAIATTGARALVEDNLVERFSGDGLRGLGDHSVFQHNTVRDLFFVNANHPDGFQSWSTGADGRVGTGEVVGTTLRGNVFVNATDTTRPLQGNLQGIGMFDGTYVDWVIEDNVVVTDHWHGITVMGARGTRVVNNTVVDRIEGNEVGPPWIAITAHKNGTPPVDCLVRNNLATAYNSAATGVAADHNLPVYAVSQHFVAWPEDLHLVATSPAIDAGTDALAPEIDADRAPRPQGAAVDVGAYEWTPPAVDTGEDDTAASEDTGDTGDTRDTAATQDSADTASPAADDTALADDAPTDAEAASCGCTSAAAGSHVPLVLGMLLARWRRRRTPGN